MIGSVTHEIRRRLRNIDPCLEAWSRLDYCRHIGRVSTVPHGTIVIVRNDRNTGHVMFLYEALSAPDGKTIMDQVVPNRILGLLHAVNPDTITVGIPSPTWVGADAIPRRLDDRDFQWLWYKANQRHSEIEKAKLSAAEFQERQRRTRIDDIAREAVDKTLDNTRTRIIPYEDRAQ